MKRFVFLAALMMMAALAVPEQSAAGAWFWREIPPAATGDDASKTSRAIEVVRKAKGGRGRLASTTTRARRISDKWRLEIDRAARRARVSEALLIAVILVESGGNPRAVSPAGAQGLAQLMPGTARRYGVTNSFDPQDNLQGGAKYLSDLLRLYRGDLVLTLAAYNAGEGAVARYNGVPPYSETRAYVPKVLSAFIAASTLCREPPRNARRRCALPRPPNL